MRWYERGRKRRLKKVDARLGDSWSSKKRLRKRGRSRAPVIPVVLIVGVLCAVYLLSSAMLGEEEPATLIVEEGDTLASVADKLEEAGVISSPTLFKLQARDTATEIKPGEYRFEPGDDILSALASGDSISSSAVTIPEGLTLEQTVQRVAEQSGVPAEELETAARSTDYGYAFLNDPAIMSTDGFLFPKQYRFDRGDDASQIVDRILAQYLAETGDLDFEGAQERFNLTGYQLVTVASLVERESANPEERPLIASVIYNRLRAGMPLQIDATVQYAMGGAKERLSLEDIEVDSPYNTYKYDGLPPGPIASPGRESIEAALEPAPSNYLYYVLEPGGEQHFFTDDYDEFLEAKSLLSERSD